jgi:hypothetical protein
MTSDELYAAFREDIVDAAKPYLWKDAEVWRYMGDAYSMFVRFIGGIPDAASDATEVQIVAGDHEGHLNTSILRIMNATRRSDGGTIAVINATDITNLRKFALERESGRVEYMVIGTKPNTCRWIGVPVVDDVCDMSVYRLPMVPVTGPGHPLSEIDEMHHIHLLDWMKHLAYKKQDGETFNAKASMDCRAAFETYCRQAKAEWERYKHKTRVVAYGGL